VCELEDVFPSRGDVFPPEELEDVLPSRGDVFPPEDVKRCLHWKMCFLLREWRGAFTV
jgi:hypothetical protein